VLSLGAPKSALRDPGAVRATVNVRPATISVSRARIYQIAGGDHLGKPQLVLFVCTGNGSSACSAPERAVKRVPLVYVERALEAGKRFNEAVLAE
jgi:hypothetical protein